MGMGRMVLALSAAIVVATPAAAQTGIVDQVEGLSADPGETSVEVQTIWVPEQDGEDSFLTGGITLDHAIRSWIVIGTEVEYEKSDALAVEEIAAQVKLTAIDPANAPIGFGAQVSIGYSIDDDVLVFDTVLIAAVERERWSGAANLVFEARDGDFARYDMRYAVRADHGLSDGLALGIEAGGELASEDARGHWIGPVLTVGDDDGGLLPEIELSAFTALNSASPEVQLRLELEWGF
jgi:hypothetical protein